MKPRTLLVVLASLACAAAQAAPETSPSPPDQTVPQNQPAPENQAAPENQPAPANQASPMERAPATGGLGMTGARPRRMANCPSALPGTSTTVKDTADGVELQITANDPATQQRLVKLAQFHAMLMFPNWFVKPHSGLGGGPGTLGFCPIIHANTMLTYTPIANGVTIHVATAPDKVSALQRETHARLGTLTRPAS